MVYASTVPDLSRLAIAAPRGHAKSTVVTLAYLLWAVLCRREPLTIIVSATKEQAVQLLKIVKDQLQTNEKLLADFPEVCRAPGRLTLKPWREHVLTLHNGCMIRALGAGQGLRGFRNGRHRPSLIIVDDLENLDRCESARQRGKLRDWFNKTLLKAGEGRTNVAVIGTILHYDSLLANLTGQVPAKQRAKDATRPMGWTGKVYRAVEAFSSNTPLWERWEKIARGEEEFEGTSGEKAARAYYAANERAMLEGTQVLWPQRESYLQLMEMRFYEGRAGFQSEKQNEPLDPEQCLFRADEFTYWDDEFVNLPNLLARLGTAARFYGACDPSLGRGGGDYTAIVTIVKDSNTNTLYVIDADIARRSPTGTLERIMALAGTYKFYWFGFEANQFQSLLADQLQARARESGLSFYPKPVSHASNKQGRIESIEPLIASGRLRFCRGHATLLEQLRQFPLGAHDDGPDALEMVVTEAAKKAIVGKHTTY